MIPYQLIAKKRDGGRHSREELEYLVGAFTGGQITEPQMAAWLMAAYLRGLDSEETGHLTEAMVASGDIVDLSGVEGVSVDKHSTGGVGDKATLVVVPLAAAVGVKVPKLSGRALGHTGGTLDKLESIPGFRLMLTADEFIRQLNKVGAVIAAQTTALVPADKKMYALRDHTATVASIPLIAASIISKKVAGGAKNILIDVKAGTGAFMPTIAQARELGAALTAVGENLGLAVRCVITDMNQPLGRAVGNALEVREAIECLAGGGPDDLRELSIHLAASMVEMAGLADDMSDAANKVTISLDSGAALRKFKELVEAQGGDSNVVEEPGLLPIASGRHLVTAQADGRLAVDRCDSLGAACAILSGGHLGHVGQVDQGAGLVMLARHGDAVKKGDPLVELFYSDRSRLADAEAAVGEALSVD